MMLAQVPLHGRGDGAFITRLLVLVRFLALVFIKRLLMLVRFPALVFIKRLLVLVRFPRPRRRLARR